MLLLVAFSCKKDNLKHKYPKFVGKWEWVYTDHVYGWCDNWEQEETLTPVTENSHYQVEFFEKGLVEFYENDVLIVQKRVVFEYYGNNTGNGVGFKILLDNNEDEILSGAILDTILRVNQFPFKGISGCEDYDHYFTKQ